jgi:16S rRNA (adenine1518-N6/adenine1519-N6)-dimethyltransferase
MNRQEILSIIRNNDLKPVHALGQHFLADGQVASLIIRLAEISDQDLVIEIGAGIGSLTEVLVRNAGRVIAVEIDARLIPILVSQVGQFQNCRIVEADAMKISFSSLAENWPGPVKVAANLPYYITTPLVEKILCELSGSSEIVLMVQKEAADRIIAGSGSKLYSPLAVLAASHGQVRREKVVPADVFIPRPRVDSSLIRINDKGKLQIEDWSAFRKFLKVCFAYRRKTLLNSLKATGYPADCLFKVQKFLAAEGLAVDLRAERLDPRELLAIFREMNI